ncbi:Rha family transcriptional regulator [Shewanella algae]|uniref:Rha family transcriptional regulator n=1 Tax=Shewanella algae TaxID=38313 RepID=UPI001AAD1B7E|nr:Rha family transcriptional regulator [Shewanella algae]MBO2688481.1 Rha family transcriptional regulator [Shewanella algae]
MSSREIAELTGKKHAHICRDIRSMLEQLGINESKFGSVYLDTKGEKRTEYRLPRRECEILVTGYDVVRRAAVIDRWLELETKQRQLPNMTPGPLRFTVDQEMIG